MKLKLLLIAASILHFGNSLAMTLVGDNSLSNELDAFNEVLEALQGDELPKGFQDAKSAIDKAQAILNNLLTNDQIRNAIASKAHYRALLAVKRFYNKSDEGLSGQAALSALDGKIRAKQTALGIVTPRPVKPVVPVVQGISAAEAKALKDEIERLQKNEQALKDQIVKGSSSDRELQLQKRIKDLEQAASQGKISSERENELLSRIKDLEAIVAKLAAVGAIPVAIGGLTPEETAKVEALGFDEKRNVKALLSSLEIIKKANLKIKDIGQAVTNLEKYSFATIRELLSNNSKDQLMLANNKLVALKAVSNELQKFATQGKSMSVQEALAITLPARSGEIFKRFNEIGAKKADPSAALMESIEKSINRLNADATQENIDKTFKSVKARAVQRPYQEDVAQLVKYFDQFKKDSGEKIDAPKLRALNKVTESLVAALDPAKSAAAIFEYAKLFNFNPAGNAVVSRKGSVFDEYLKIGKAVAEAPQMGGDAGQAPAAPQAPGAPMAPNAPDVPAGEAPAAPSAPGAPEAPML